MDDAQNPTLLDTCTAVLHDNWRETHTIPAAGLYPHQWLWDSCFIAIGQRHIDVERAKTEINSLMQGQWDNGMLPHMIFKKNGSASRDRQIWQSWRNSNAPENVDTSGLTQPPMLAEAIVRVGEMMPLKDRREWFLDVLPKLQAYHRWIYADRDPHQEGLALLIHPWESGLDNSPPWITQLHIHNKPLWVTAVEKLKLDSFVLLVRRDTKHVPPGQRLSSIDALLYYSVLQRLRRKNWDIDLILSRSHFAIEDLAFNSILVRANSHLETIAKTAGHILPKDLVENTQRSRDALEKLWHDHTKQYYSRNFVTHKLIKQPTIATLLPLYAGSVSQERAEELVKLLHDKRLFDLQFPIPSVPLTSNYYSELGYWQGPTWLNTNWLVIDGLKRYGFETEAEHITKQTLKLVKMHGPYEYFSAKNGDPAGASNFSWSAAIVIDLLK